MNNILQNKSLQLALTISIFILIVILLLSPSKKTENFTNTDTISQPRPELLDLSKEKRREVMVYVETIENKLPITLDGFNTSVGIDTSINIFRVNSDEAEIVRLEIYGLSYMNPDTNEKTNPNVTAFKESYLKALELIESNNIDPKKLIFIYSDKEYIRKTSQIWLESLKLLP